MAAKLRKGDKVIVLAGKDKGKPGKKYTPKGSAIESKSKGKGKNRNGKPKTIKLKNTILIPRALLRFYCCKVEGFKRKPLEKVQIGALL